MFSLKICKTINNQYFLTQSHLQFKKSYKQKNNFKYVTNDNKLSNNISRAKSTIFNILSYNRFYFFYTQTVDPIYARNDLALLVNKFSSITRQLRKEYPQLNFYYLFIPEYHSDKQNWHIHGFLSQAYNVLLYKNKNGFNSLLRLNKIGFNSASKIKNYVACCKYATKYITKELLNDIKKGERIYYCSKGLKRDNMINNLTLSNIAPVHFDFKNEFVFKTTLEEDEYNNFITNLDKIKRLHYFI